MAHLKSSKKRIRQSRKAALRNKAMRSALRTALKKVRGTTDPEAASKALSAAVPLLDRTARKGVIHPNTAARHKSRLTRLVNGLGKT